MNLQWFPGHMAKTRRLISEQLGRIDVVLEIVDARAPKASRNPEIDEITKGKPRVIAINKSDLADSVRTAEWVEYFQGLGIVMVPISSISGENFGALKNELKAACKDKQDRSVERGMTGRAIKILVMGIPNVGKSAFINKFSGRGVMETGDRPGVTRNPQWIRLAEGYDLLDTPGVLWPKFDDEQTALALAWTGAIKDEIMDTAEVAVRLCDYLMDNYEKELRERYKLEWKDENEEEYAFRGYEILLEIGRKRGCIIAGGEVDEHRAAGIVLDEFRAAKIGKMTVERVREDD
ncbi:ribosome biogenesis GTPase A [Clostridia bacterium]|nr:ribosome biogenesis GTPase A [Clostridia bacterium]